MRQKCSRAFKHHGGTNKRKTWKWDEMLWNKKWVASSFVCYQLCWKFYWLKLFIDNFIKFASIHVHYRELVITENKSYRMVNLWKKPWFCSFEWKLHVDEFLMHIMWPPFPCLLYAKIQLDYNKRFPKTKALLTCYSRGLLYYQSEKFTLDRKNQS